MAANFGAINSKIIPKNPTLFKPLYQPPFLFNFTYKPLFRSSYQRVYFSITMAENNPKTQSPEIKEPSTKLQKIETHENQNGNHQSFNTVSFFKVKKLSEKAVIPSRGSLLSAGYDLSSAVDTKVPARGKALVATDLSIAVPPGTYARVAPRSGLAWKHSIDVGAGVIDADYRGPVGVILFNHSDVDFEVKTGDRIAQLIIEKIITPDVIEVDDLDSTDRGAGGFGSTGV
ncbi:unnamed protein product [Amaranthus hypochondriacus]